MFMIPSGNLTTRKMVMNSMVIFYGLLEWVNNGEFHGMIWDLPPVICYSLRTGKWPSRNSGFTMVYPLIAW